MKRTAIKVVVIPILIAVFSAVVSLAQNLYATESAWPGPLDYVRRYPLPSMLVGLVLLAGLAVYDRWPTNERRDTQDVGLNIQNNYGPITFNGARAAAEPEIGPGPSQAPEITQALIEPTADVGEPTRPVVFWISPWLDSSWEHATVQAMKADGRDILCLRLNDSNTSIPNLTAIIIVISAAHFPQARRQAISELKSARTLHGGVRALLIAADLTDEPVSHDDAHSLMKVAGYASGEFAFECCETEDLLKATLRDHLTTAISLAVDRDRLNSLLNRPLTGKEDA